MKAMKKAQNLRFVLFSIKAISVTFVTLFFSAAWFVIYAQSISNPFHSNGNYAIVVVFCILFTAFCKLYGGFSVGALRISEMLYSNIIALLVSNGLMYGVIVLLTRRMVNPAGIIWALLCQLLWCAIWAVYSKKLYLHLQPAKACVIIYENKASRDSVLGLDENCYNVQAVLNIQEIADIEYLEENIAGIECIFLCGVQSVYRNEIIKYCILNNITAFVRPHISDLIISGAKRLQMRNVPVLQCTKSTPSAWYMLCKRCFDICVSLFGIVVTSPVLLITAALIKLSDKGPALFTQLRMTKDRKVFKIYKFRSMKVDAEKDGKARLASVNDDRITSIGKFIRMCRIDEIPQLFNILKGDMSVVGPRPERPEIAADYETEIPEFAMRLQVKAGLTGYAQVYGKYNTTPYDKLQMDLMYIANMGIIEDIKIIFATLKILFMPESTEGVGVDISNSVYAETLAQAQLED